MNGIFGVFKVIGDGVSPETAYRIWPADMSGFQSTHGIGNVGDTYWAGIIYAEDQTLLDSIGADSRTPFAFAIDVSGQDTALDDRFELPPFTRGKVTSWMASNIDGDFDIAGTKNRRLVAVRIVQSFPDYANVDPLKGFTARWD